MLKRQCNDLGKWLVSNYKSLTMQKFTLIPMLMLLLTIVSCDKKSVLIDHELIGTWELFRQGGMAPAITYVAGNGNRLIFTDGNYQLYTDGSLVKSGTYAIKDDNAAKSEVCLELAEGTFQRRIIFDWIAAGRKEFFEISGDTLHLLSGCFAYDAGVAKTYIRKATDSLNNAGH